MKDMKPNFMFEPDPKKNPVTGRAGLLRVSQVFRTLQGEGPEVGTPTVFVRLLRCNRHCIWCDTEPQKREFRDISPSDLSAELRLLPEPDVCITGGEPLLQEIELFDLAAEIGAIGKRPTLETNGELMRRDFPWGIFHRVSVSPKLPSAGFYTDPNIVHLIKQVVGQPNACLKFVCHDAADYLFLQADIAPLIPDFVPFYIQPTNHFPFLDLYDLWKRNPIFNAVLRPQVHKLFNLP